MKHVKISLHLIKLNIEKDLMYSLNTWFLLATTFFYALTFILSFRFVYFEVDTVLGITFDEMLIYILSGQLFWFLHQVFIRKSLQNLADLINEGKLDMFLIRPLSLRKIVPFLEFDQRHVLPSIVSFFVLVYLLSGYDLGIVQVIAIVAFFINGLLISFFVTLIFATLTFWSGRNDELFHVMMYMVDILRLPMVFFSPVLKYIFVFVIPVISILNPSMQILFGEAEIWFLVVSVATTVILFVLAEVLWRRGLKSYTSAN